MNSQRGLPSPVAVWSTISLRPVVHSGYLAKSVTWLGLRVRVRVRVTGRARARSRVQGNG